MDRETFTRQLDAALNEIRTASSSLHALMDLIPGTAAAAEWHMLHSATQALAGAAGPIYTYLQPRAAAHWIEPEPDHVDMACTVCLMPVKQRAGGRTWHHVDPVDTDMCPALGRPIRAMVAAGAESVPARGLASCGHPADEDGEHDCSWWPERAPVHGPWDFGKPALGTGPADA